MTKMNEGGANPSLIVRSFEPSVSVDPDKMVPVDLSGTEESKEQAPRKRGLLGPFGEKHSLQGARRCLRALVHRPQVRVWGPVVAKAVGTLGMLSCVALLGFHSREEDTYGAIATAASQVELGNSLSDLDSAVDSHAAIHEQSKSESQSESGKQCPVPPPCQDEKPQAVGVAADGRIILNEASEDELTRLPGVGKSRAEAIVALRKRLKGFRKVSDLLRIRGIGWRTLQKMKDKIVLNRPPPEQVENPEQGDPVVEKG